MLSKARVIGSKSERYVTQLIKICSVKRVQRFFVEGRLKVINLTTDNTNESKTFLSPYAVKTKDQNNYGTLKLLLTMSLLQWLGDKDDEEKESELIMTLKRSILCQRRGEFAKAEQMLHIALRLAQQQNSKDGVMYAYDLMANLAFERLELEKAQKLFVTVMQMLMAGGVTEDDLKIIHISLKLARINHLLAKEETAEIGYKWCLEKIQKHRSLTEDGATIYGYVCSWYAQFLLDRNDVENSLAYLKEAYKVCCDAKMDKSEDGMILLNDLGMTCWRAGDLEKSGEFLSMAEKIGVRLEDQGHLGVVKANLGLIYLEKGLSEKAEQLCREGWKLGKKYSNEASVEQSNYCMEQIRTFLSDNKNNLKS